MDMMDDGHHVRHRHDLPPRKRSETLVGLAWGFLVAIVVTWSTYISMDWSPLIGGPPLYNRLRAIWRLISLPGVLLSDITGIEMEDPVENTMTAAGYVLISLFC